MLFLAHSQLLRLIYSSILEKDFNWRKKNVAQNKATQILIVDCLKITLHWIFSDHIGCQVSQEIWSRKKYVHRLYHADFMALHKGSNLQEKSYFVSQLINIKHCSPNGYAFNFRVKNWQIWLMEKVYSSFLCFLFWLYVWRGIYKNRKVLTYLSSYLFE